MFQKHAPATWRGNFIASFAALSLFVGLARAQEATAPANATSDDEAAIRATADAYEKAFAASDAKALAAAFSEDGELTVETGHTFKGRDEIEREYSAIFADRAGSKIDVQIESIKFLSPDVAVETGTAQAESKSSASNTGTKYTAVHVKRDGKWLLANVNESRAAAPIEKEPLAALAFLVGEWKANLDAGKTYESRCEWMPGKGFLKRTFSVKDQGKELTSGVQIVGYDPLASEIVSWTFDSSGGFGHELWESHGGRWRISASSVLPDGGTGLSTNYLTKGDDNSFTWQSVERSLNDQLLPDTALVRVQRVSE